MRKFRKLLLVLLLAALAVGLVWAGAELFGQSNQSAADAGSNGAKLEIITINMIKPPKKKKANVVNIDERKEASLKKQMEANTVKYNQVVAKFKAEIASSAESKGSAATASEGMQLAKAFNDLSEQYAKVWDAAGNCKTRARLARESGKARVANAEMVFSNMDSDKIDAYNKQSEERQKACSEYVADAKEDLDPADRQSLQDNLLPKAKGLLSNVSDLSSQVSNLLQQVTSQVGDVTSNPMGAIGGCARGGGSSDNPAMALLSPLKALSGMVMNMLSNVKALISDIMSLA